MGCSQREEQKEKEGRKKEGNEKMSNKSDERPGRVVGQFFSPLSLTISSHHRCRPSVRENEAILFVL
jgi:hypothetical protein